MYCNINVQEISTQVSGVQMSYAKWSFSSHVVVQLNKVLVKNDTLDNFQYYLPNLEQSYLLQLSIFCNPYNNSILCSHDDAEVLLPKRPGSAEG